MLSSELSSELTLVYIHVQNVCMFRISQYKEINTILVGFVLVVLPHWAETTSASDASLIKRQIS